MHISTLASALLVSSSHVSSLVIAPRVENYKDEAVWIVNCEQYWKTTDTTPQTTQDYLWHYKNFDDVLDGKIKKPDGKAYARLPAGHPTQYEHIQWTLATDTNKITATFPDWGNFWVYGLDEEGDSHTHVTGHANLNGNDMRCYTKPKAKVNIKYGTEGKGIEKCETKWLCTRANRQIKRTKIEISNEFIEVQMKSMSAMELQSRGLSVDPIIEQNILKAMDHLQTETGIDFSTAIDPKFDQYQMTFDVKMAESEGDAQYDSTKIPRITEEIKKMAPELAKGGRMGSCGSFYTTYGSDCFYYIPLPKEIAITVQTADQETQNWTPKDTITVGVTNGNCADKSASSVMLVALFAGAAGVLTGGLSATVAGIGAVVSQAYSVSC
jgi:hypothetical protein